jgi:pimeloyl-ACP methyl ester carboxylesterase
MASEDGALLARGSTHSPRATVAASPDAGHLVNQDQPHRFNRVLIGFLQHAGTR